MKHRRRFAARERRLLFGLSMRELYRRDGTVVIFGDANDRDELVVEPKINSFIPIRGNSSCVCGAELQPWSLRHTVNGVELSCARCHRVHGFISTGVWVHR